MGCKFMKAFKDSVGSDWKSHYYWVKPINDLAVERIGKYTADGNSIEFTKFPIGWTNSQYWRKPATYTVEEECLDAEDRMTKKILLYIGDQIEYRNTKYRGIPCELVVRCRTRPAVQKVLDTMAAQRLAMMKELVMEGGDESGSEDLQIPQRANEDVPETVAAQEQ